MNYNKKEQIFLKKIGSKIRASREFNGWSQEYLSLECDIHRTYIGSVERGERNISVINLKKIADALGIQVTTLFEGNE